MTLHSKSQDASVERSMLRGPFLKVLHGPVVCSISEAAKMLHVDNDTINHLLARRALTKCSKAPSRRCVVVASILSFVERGDYIRCA